MAENLHTGRFPVEIGWRECANGETYEFFLVIGTVRVDPYVSVFETVRPGVGGIEMAATRALKKLLRSP